MRVLVDRKKKNVRIKVDRFEELEELKDYIEKGSVVSGYTLRNRFIVRDGRKVKCGKERVRVSIVVEKVELTESGLKLLGEIIDSSNESKGYHSILLREGEEITVSKEWEEWEIDELRKLEKASDISFIACILDEREATVFRIGRKVEEIATIFNNTSKSVERSILESYIKDVARFLERFEEPILVCGPGFAREKLYKELRRREKDVFLDRVSSTGICGLRELFKRCSIRVLQERVRVREEVEEIEKFFERLARGDELVVYGKEEVVRAIEMCAVDKLLISSRLVREFKDYISMCRKCGGKVSIISTSHEEGVRFFLFCGIAAYLRFRID